MHRSLKVFLILIAALAGCASQLDRAVSDRLVGSWVHEISIFGEKTRSVLTLYPNGTFVEARETKNSVVTGLHRPVNGNWRASAEHLELVYPSGFDGIGKLEIDRRVIVLVNQNQFISKDTEFGIPISRIRASSD